MSNQRLYHAVAEEMKRLIRDGVFPPGSRLPGERDLAERFNVSRVTIREAEITLQALGYLKIKTGSGVYVLEQPSHPHEGLPQVTAFELTEARSMFESEAAALAARQIDDDALARLEALIIRMSSTDPADDEDSQQADREFHLTIAESSGNAAVRYVVETLWKLRTELPAVRDVHAAICAKEDAGDRGTEHADIIGALKNRDPSAARDAMQRHFRHLLESMIDVTEEQAMAELRQRATQSRERYLKPAQG
ncbi:MAG: FadR/GntR family transcriptional regulator [Pseudomonadota bacterium]